MKYPYCGNEMARGYLWLEQKYGLSWLPEGEELPFLLAEKVLQKEMVSIGR